MKLKETNGSVEFIMIAGKDLVRHKMPLHEAEKLVKNGKVSKSERFAGYPLCVDNTYFFAAVLEKKSKSNNRG